MKRNFLIVALVGAFAMALLGSAQKAMATCPPGVSGSQFNANYAIKVQGAVTDTGACGTSCPDPQPNAIAGIGVLHMDGQCDITGSDFIYSVENNPAGISSPAVFNLAGPPEVPTFSGSTASANGTGTYGCNSNNQCVITWTDTPSGITFSFGVTAELGNSEFRGARVNPGDPLVILGEKQATVTSAQFLNQATISFDAAGGGSAAGILGIGFDATTVELTTHLDPETNSTPEGGGVIFFNLNNGYGFIPGLNPGLQVSPPGGGALICDFHLQVIQQSTSDGTQLSDAAVNNDFSCPLATAHFETVNALWGATNSSAFVMNTGANGNAAPSAADGTAGRAIAAGAGTGGVATLAETNTNLHPLATITLKDSAPEPIDFTGLVLNSVPDVAIAAPENSQCTGSGTPAACCTGSGTGTCTASNCTGPGTPFHGCSGSGTGSFSTCSLVGGNLAANDVLEGPGSCTVVVQGTGAHQCTSNGNASCTSGGHPFTCCTGSGTGTCVTESGNLEVQNNDHTFTGATQFTNANCTGSGTPQACCTGAGTGSCSNTGAEFSVKCL